MRRFFRAPEHIYKLMGKKIIALLCSKRFIIWTYVIVTGLLDSGIFSGNKLPSMEVRAPHHLVSLAVMKRDFREERRKA